MTTPERVLELAGMAEYGSLQSNVYDQNDYSEVAAILRHYAEIMQAEPVGRFDVYDGKDGSKSYIQIKAECDALDSVELIIKPKPPT